MTLFFKNQVDNPSFIITLSRTFLCIRWLWFSHRWIQHNTSG